MVRSASRHDYTEFRLYARLNHTFADAMYESFFGLSGKPFQLNPDPRSTSAARAQRAFAYLQ